MEKSSQPSLVQSQAHEQFEVAPIMAGFEFGYGSISGLTAKTAVREVVKRTIYNDPNILVPIDRDDDGQLLADDGCGDGRGVRTIFSLDRHYKRSLNRSKVFGGAAMMAAACLIGLGEQCDGSLNDLLDVAIQKLDEHQMDFGAHTDEHMHGKNCGCGAIDNAPQILLASLKYEIPIRGAVTLLTDNIAGLNQVYGNFRTYASQLAHNPEYSGMRVMETILHQKRSRVVKQLGGGHRECRIVLNAVPEHTVNQKLIRETTDGAAQIFAVDVWRMQTIAEGLYDDPAKQRQALLSELIYTVATAAVLTKGDLPIDLIRPGA